MSMYAKIQNRLCAFDFIGLFTQELLWNRFQMRPLEIAIDGTTYTLNPVAQRGMAVFECVALNGDLPTYSIRRKIDTQVSKTAREHIIIFKDAKKTVQVWQWVKRESGKPSVPREQIYYAGETGDALIQKIQRIAFTLDEEPSVTESVARVDAALNVERVTKRFYDEFKREHDRFLAFTEGIPDEKLRHWYVSVMLNRLMFIYFIQQKRFLNDDADYLIHKLEESKTHGKDRYYHNFLCPLFFEGLAKRPEDRSMDAKRLLGKIPHLNGGLFLRHQIEEKYGKRIGVPDEAFDRIFTFFGTWDWHLDARPNRSGREIDPNVLGHVFEKYVNQKQMGAYYSREDITEYIGCNAILPTLLGKVEEECKVAFEGAQSVWKNLQRNPDAYIQLAVLKGIDEDLPDTVFVGLKDTSRREHWNKVADAVLGLAGETWREVVARRELCAALRAKLKSGSVASIDVLVSNNLDIRRFAEEVIANSDGPELVRAFYHTLRKISILDPTCGSGAFLFAALNILEPLYDACIVRMQAFIDDLERLPEMKICETYADFRKILAEMNDKLRHPSPRYFILKSIILNNLYGVDIMEEATEICKLRLFLKLVAQVTEGEKIEPLPDIDFNIRPGNALVGFATEDELDSSHAGATEFDFENNIPRIKEQAAIAGALYERFRELLTISAPSEKLARAKEGLQEQFATLGADLDRHSAGEYGIAKSSKTKLEAFRASYQPFHWFAEFYEIMKRGGFDVIIGNPPYVEYRKVVGDYTVLQKKYASFDVKNLYAFCMERAATLLTADGWFGMIVPSAAIGVREARPLRKLLLKRFDTTICSTYGIRPAKLFDGVDHRLCIYIASSDKAAPPIVTSKFNHWSSNERPTLFQNLAFEESFDHPTLHRIAQVGTPMAALVLRKLVAMKKTVSMYESRMNAKVTLFYHRSPRYWIRALDSEPYFKSDTREHSIHHIRELTFDKIENAHAIGALLNSSLFFFWFMSIGNGRNLTEEDVAAFPIGELHQETIGKLGKIFQRLMKDYDKNSFIRKRRDCEFQEYRVNLSKPILDEIDDVLGFHFEFTPEETDFIKNFEIKYRLGADDGDDTEP